MLDPGIGFGKTLEHNLELLARLDEIVALGRPVVVGVSRKSFLGKITGRELAGRAARPRRERPRAQRGPPSSASTTSPRRSMRSRWRLLAWRADGRDPEDYDDDDRPRTDDDEREGPRSASHRDRRALALHPHGVTGRARGRPAARPRRPLRRRRAGRDGHGPRRGHGRLRRGLPGDRADGPQRSYKTLERLCAVIAERLTSPVRRPERDGQGLQARATIPLPLEEVSVEVWREGR